MTTWLTFDGAVKHDPAVDAWLDAQLPGPGAVARAWFGVMRACGPRVRELVHDGCPVACVDDAPFAYVNVFKAHVNVGFFDGAALPDPAGILQGTGRRGRHVKVRPGVPLDAAALERLVHAAYAYARDRADARTR